jgi:eukaryotic-like serine/threonine-protein kinase
MTKSNPGMAGRVLNGRYELTEKVGEGGMALTWKARDLLLGRTVAVKIMRETLAASPQFITRFRQEAQAAGSLSQEHVAAVYDFGSDAGLHYIVMEFVSGEDLRQRLKREGALAPLDALELAIQVAEALEAAHAHGIVHRDIKPANILLSEKGAVKVTDFGIARAFSGEDTGTDSLMGSVHYLSPEQARGDPVGPQADIYSLGAVLFEMLTGRPPFSASNPVAVVHKHLYDLPPAPHSLQPTLPLEVDTVVLRCLDKSLANRYATAGELLNYLRSLRGQLLARESSQEKNLSPGLPHWKRTGIGRKWPALAGGIALLVGVAAFLVLRGGPQVYGDRVILPELVGLDLTSAQAVAGNYNFRLIEGDPVYSPAIPKDKIVQQFPAAGEQIDTGSTVQVQISLGSELVRIPQVTEMREAQARGIIEQSGLKVGLIQEDYNASMPEGLVISADPASGSEVPRNTAVNLTVSKGGENTASGGSSAGDGKTEGAAAEQSINFSLPPAFSEAEVIVEAQEAEEGRIRVLYRGHLEAGEAIPSLKLPAIRPLTIRIKLNGQIAEEKSFRN